MTRSCWSRLLAVGLAAFSMGTATFAAPPEDPTGAPREKGKVLYSTYCARCHGADGTDTTTYAGAKTLLNITQRLEPSTVIEKSRGFAAVQLEGENAAALYAHLETFRDGGWPNAHLLVETDWVANRLKSPTVQRVDMRSAEAFAAGHIPGALRIAEGPLRDPNDPLDYLPKPEAFAEMMSNAGIGNDTHVVIYDDAGGRSAARLWFVLNAYGHEKVSLMNGGWLKWAAEKRPVTPDAASVRPAAFTPKKIPNAVCAAPELLARKPGVVVLDTRSAAEFKGEQMSGGAKKAGRIPNSVHVDWRESVEGPFQVFKSAAALKKLYESKGVTPDKEVVTY